MYSDVVLWVNHWWFEEILNKTKKEVWVLEDTDLSADNLKQLVVKYKKFVIEQMWMSFPEDPIKQLERAIMAVFDSWQIPRAIKYRKIHKIPDDMWTAVNIQSMVFGNMWDTSWTWVAFTRDPSTWEKKLFWEFLMNAQWEDVVAWIRTPKPISYLKSSSKKVFLEFKHICENLEKHFTDMQDIEFTIEEWKLYILQTRNWKRSAFSWVKIAVDMFEEKLIDKKTALLRIDPNLVDQILHPMIDSSENKESVAKWIPASPWAACGKVYFTAEDAEKAVSDWEKVILLRHETNPEDIWWMHVSEGILTACGWATSHAAVVARWMWTPCVSWASTIIVNAKQWKASIWEIIILKWDYITINWNTWEVFIWKCKMKAPKISWDFEKILKWSDEYRTLRIRTNADTIENSKKAREFWAEWIGLCRTEHMFFEKDRIKVVREMILAKDEKARIKALDKLLPFQRDDFKWILKAMNGLPVTIRLLDPPLHEFLPTKDRDIKDLAKTIWLTFEQVKDKVNSLHETNPMLWHRWCRLMMTYPEIAKMQTRAVVEAAIALRKKWIDARPEIMIPLIWTESEFVTLKHVIETEMRQVQIESDFAFEIPIGTMIELPRACIISHWIAKHAAFFSFWTNDLTQMTFGYSRDDVWKFLPEYIEKKYIESDPFQTLDVKWVWTLIQIWVRKWKWANRNIKIWICWEHWWDPSSIDFFYHNDFEYVSCSPFRVPIARIAAAQSYLRKWG